MLQLSLEDLIDPRLLDTVIWCPYDIIADLIKSLPSLGYTVLAWLNRLVLILQRFFFCFVPYCFQDTKTFHRILYFELQNAKFIIMFSDGKIHKTLLKLLSKYFVFVFKIQWNEIVFVFKIQWNDSIYRLLSVKLYSLLFTTAVQ